MAETSKTPNLNDPAYFDVALELVAMVNGTIYHRLQGDISAEEKQAWENEAEKWFGIRRQLLSGKIDATDLDGISENAAKRLKELDSAATLA